MRSLALFKRKSLAIGLAFVVVLVAAAMIGQFGQGVVVSLAAAFVTPVAILMGLAVLGWGLSKARL